MKILGELALPEYSEYEFYVQTRKELYEAFEALTLEKYYCYIAPVYHENCYKVVICFANLRKAADDCLQWDYNSDIPAARLILKNL